MKFDKKHRPKSLNEVIFASTEVKKVIEDYGNNLRDKHILLHGPKGTGKSVSAQLVLKQRMGVIWQAGLGDPWNAKAYQAEHDTFSPVLNQWNMQLSMGARTGVSVFDEIDQFSLPMQQKLRAFIEQYEIGMVIATTNNLHLLDGPLKDRFRRLLVEYPSVAQWVPRVVSVMAAEGIPVTPTQAAGLLKGFAGSGRSLNDWLEDYVFRLQSKLTQVTATLSAPAQPCAQNTNG